MPGVPYTPPVKGSDGFNCPHCSAYANQIWWTSEARRGMTSRDAPFELALCGRCLRFSVWLDKRMIFPDLSAAPLAHEDLPEAVAADYAEAASVLSRSPRAAVALLRLAVERLCRELGKAGDLNSAIKELVAEGLDPRVQKSLDIVRVTGNNAVHPGEMDIGDDAMRALALFNLVNEIAEAMIARPRRLEELYGSLPEGARDAIEKRDASK